MQADKLSSSRLRWFWASFLLLASALNYVDRQALSILAPTIQHDLRITNVQYGYVIQVFLVCYAVMYFVSGRVVDRLTAHIAESAFILLWSVAGILTSFVTGFRSLLAVRGMLGLAEPGNYTASAKVVAEWFPPHERGTAVGLYSMGGTIGAAIAAPLVAYVAIRHSWRSAFVSTGVAGIFLALFWLTAYRPSHSREHVAAEVTEHPLPPSLPNHIAPRSQILLSKPLWIIVWSRMTTDPVWYFYLFWFPKYLQDVLHMSLAALGKLLWTVFVAADAGSVLGGFAASRRIKRGGRAATARVRIMLAAAVIPCFSFIIPALPGYKLPIAAACLAAFAHMAWMTNATTLPLDIFPTAQIGSVQGMVGAISSVAAFVSTGLIAFSVSHFSYRPVFVIASFLYPLALIALIQLPKTLGKGNPALA